MQAIRPLLCAAAVLTLLISACSQPDDYASPPLETQFGTPENDGGTHVASVSTGRIYALGKEFGYDSWEDTQYGKVVLRRFDGSGNLAWTRNVETSFCNGYYDDCQALFPLSLETNAQSYVFVLYSSFWSEAGDCAYENYYQVKKINESGFEVATIRLPNNGRGYGESNATDYAPSAAMAVDGSGNVYVAQQKADFAEDYCSAVRTNVVAKYSPSGSLLWQRTSTVGVPKDITVSSSGSVYVVGTKGLARYSNSGGLSWTKTGNFEEVVISGSNLYTRYRKDVRKYDSTGKQVWLKSQSGLSTMVLQSMDGDGSGNVYLSGKYDADSSSNLSMNAMIRKLNSSGSVLWTKTYGTSSAYDDAKGIATITGSEIYTTGLTKGSLAHTNIGGEDGYLRKFSSSGGTVWTR